MSLTIINDINVFQKDVIGNVRTAQEDSHDIALATPNGDVFVVCDGMGGHVGGKQASSIAVKAIIDYLQQEKYPQPIQALNDALQFANMQILGYANEHPELRGMGTTACIVLLQESEAYIAHVGDSRIYLYLGKEKQLHRITKDHSFVQTLVDAGQITDEEAEHHPNKNRILKALGIRADLIPSFDRVRPKSEDIFLICSDGLSGMMSDYKMRDILASDATLDGKGNALIDLALEAGGLDNITLELIRVENSPYSTSEFTSYNPVVKTNVAKQPSKAPVVGNTNKNRYWIAALVSIVIGCVCCALAYVAIQVWQTNQMRAAISAEITKVIKDLDKNRENLNRTEAEYKEAESMLKEVEADLKKSPKNSKYRALYQKREKEVAELSNTVNALKAEIEQLEKQKDSINNVLNSL